MNFSKIAKMLLSFSLLCCFCLSANILTETDVQKAQAMKYGKVYVDETTKAKTDDIKSLGDIEIKNDIKSLDLDVVKNKKVEKSTIRVEKPFIRSEKPYIPSSRDCADWTDWTDSYGDGCSYYDNNTWSCGATADSWANSDGLSANQACCACGGGTDDGGGDPDPYENCTGNPGWAGDGYCDGSNNNADCLYDGGDCCPSTCVDGTYSCASNGGDCDDCIDPAAEDANGGGSCAGGPVCGDGVCEDGEAAGDSGCYADCGCLDGEFDCGAAEDGWYGNCISGGWACDGYADCNTGADEADCGAPPTCEEQGLWDCGDGQCISSGYVCDGSADTCNASWGPDCANGADESLATCGEDHDECTTPDPDCATCTYDWTAYGAECCDSAWRDLGIDCATLEGTYGWDCSGCSCPGDPADVCGDGACTGDETYETCAADCDAPVTCDDCVYDWTAYGSECCDTAFGAFGFDCATLESTYNWDCSGCSCPGDAVGVCGDGTCQWAEDETSCPDDCQPDPYANCTGNPSWAADGWCDASNNNADCLYDGGDCCPSTCVDGTYSCASYGGDCEDCIDPAAEDSNYGGSCTPPATCEDETACNTGAEGDCSYPDTGYNCDGTIADGYHLDCAGDLTSDSILSWIGDGYCDGVDEAYGVNYQCCEFNFDNGDCGDAIGCDGTALECGGASEDCAGECGGSAELDVCGECAGDGYDAGDFNSDCGLDVLDVIVLVNAVVDGADLAGGDLNGDGGTNVIDVVVLVNLILGSGRTADANTA